MSVILENLRRIGELYFIAPVKNINVLDVIDILFVGLVIFFIYKFILYTLIQTICKDTKKQPNYKKYCQKRFLKIRFETIIALQFSDVKGLEFLCLRAIFSREARAGASVGEQKSKLSVKEGRAVLTSGAFYATIFMLGLQGERNNRETNLESEA